MAESGGDNSRFNFGTDNETALEYVNPALQLDDENESVPAKKEPFKLPPPPKEPHTKTLNESTEKHTENNNKVNEIASGTYPVYYNNANGNIVVTHEQPATTVDQANPVIQTSNTSPQNEPGPQRWRDVPSRQRPLTTKRLRLLKIFGIIAAFVFFPLGIPAAIFAFKAETELHAGILKGNIDTAQKCAKRSERLIIFSWMFAILVAVITFALVERSLLTHDEKNSVRNRIMPP